MHLARKGCPPLDGKTSCGNNAEEPNPRPVATCLRKTALCFAKRAVFVRLASIQVRMDSGTLSAATLSTILIWWGANTSFLNIFQ